MESSLINSMHDTPSLSDLFMSNLDIFYVDWNEITFYIEDTNKERYFFNILKALFPEVSLDRIIALNGKRNVIKHCEENMDSPIIGKKIYIVDLDFDKILREKRVLNNLIYLKKYSIENYLVDNSTIREIVRNYNPSVNNDYVLDDQIGFDQTIEHIIDHYFPLTIALCVNRIFDLGVEFPTIDVNKCFRFTNEGVSKRIDLISNYISDIRSKVYIEYWEAVELLLQSIIKSNRDWLNLIPGKYILSFLFSHLKNKRLITQLDNDTFFYQLTKETNKENFSDLKRKVYHFLN